MTLAAKKVGKGLQRKLWTRQKNAEVGEESTNKPLKLKCVKKEPTD
jgi:hypothetical protein